MGVGEPTGRHFGEGAGPQDVEGGGVGFVTLQALFQEFVGGKLDGDVRESEEVGGHAAPEYEETAFAVE